MMRKVSHMLDCRLLCRAKTPIFFSSITLAAIVFILYTYNIIFGVSLQSPGLKTKGISEVLQILKTESLIKTTIIDIPLRSMRQDIQEVDNEHQNTLLAPLKVTEEERIEWFRKKLPAFDIFKSDNLTSEFHVRVQEFFNNDCEVQFFMTWILPAATFGRREFLAMESLLKGHPYGCLMILSRDMDSSQGYKILKPLHDLQFKVAAVAPDLPFLFNDTPAEAWFNEMKSGKKDPGEIPLAQNLSNLIRLAALYKYGGVYLDTDFIVLKSFKGLRNSIGAQSIDMVSKNWTRLNNAVLVFDRNHPLLFKFMEEFALTFDGNRWGYNGPYLVTRVVQRFSGRPGYNFTVLSPMAFYPIYWTRIGSYFKKPENRAGSKWVKAQLLQLRRETYGVHLWNKQSKRFRIEEGSFVHRLILDHCVICQYT